MTHQEAMKIAVLIPAYNEEARIAKVILKSLEHAEKVVVCDDGSTDMTAKIAKAVGAEVISHGRNLGYGASLASLFEKASIIDADAFVTIDGDDQHDPEEIPSLVEPISAGRADMVVGSRFLGKSNSPGYRSVGVKVITVVSNQVNDTDLTDSQTGFRAYSRKAVPLVVPSDLGMGASTEILLKARKAGLRVVEVPVSVWYLRKGSRNPVYHGVVVLLSSIKHLSILHPLIVYGLPGFAMMIYGLYLGSNALGVYELTRKVIVGTTLIAMGSILVGLILAITALILWIMITLMRDPLYRAPIPSSP